MSRPWDDMKVVPPGLMQTKRLLYNFFLPRFLFSNSLQKNDTALLPPNLLAPRAPIC